MSARCRCCTGVEAVTPGTIWNRPHLKALAYRVGAHAEFLETMQARLSAADLPALATLTSRSPADPALALLDAWATVADVLTFYQERIANEGYLATATERRSVLELARLTGYQLRPGVSASVYLAYSLEPAYDVTIDAGALAQTLPGPDERPQPFETADALPARAAWNTLKPRISRPQLLRISAGVLYLDGAGTNLRPNDLILLPNPAGGQPVPRWVERAEPDAVARRTAVMLRPLELTIVRTRPDLVPLLGAADGPMSGHAAAVTPPLTGGPGAPAGPLTSPLTPAPPSAPTRDPGEARLPTARMVIDVLGRPASAPPANASALSRSVTRSFRPNSALMPHLLGLFRPELGGALYDALAGQRLSEPPPASVTALRVKAAPFGHNAPLRPRYSAEGTLEGYDDWPLAGATTISVRAVPFTGTPFSPRVVSAITLAVSDERGSRNLRVPLNVDQTEQAIDQPWVEGHLTLGNAAPAAAVAVNVPQVTLTFSLRFPESGRQLQITVGVSAATVAFSDAAGDLPASPLVVSAGPRLRQTEAGARLTVEYGADAFTFSAEIAATPIGDALRRLDLDAVYDGITPESFVVLKRPGAVNEALRDQIHSVQEVQQVTRTDYGITAKVTRLILDGDWLDASDTSLAAARDTTVYAQSEPLMLGEEPVTDEIGVLDEAGSTTVELDRLYPGLEPGRWLIVAGERTDLPGGGTGVRAAELAMIAAVEHGWQPVKPGAAAAIGGAALPDPNEPIALPGPADPAAPAGSPQGVSAFSGAGEARPGEQRHTIITLASPLSYRYARASVTLYGNVVRATHGQSQSEVLGSGDAGKVFQQFTLKQKPLTYLTAPTPAGAESTLEVRVDGVRWHEVERLTSLGPTDRAFISRTNDEQQSAALFGDGIHGARLPAGQENVSARYRSGIGAVGNARAGQISLLMSRPLGVRDVINPLPATGGADRESRDQARRNAPLGVMALDRLVGLRDYADFARTFAGVGKASAARLSDGRRQSVQVTVAGAGDNPIDPASDLFRNLRGALLQYGDPQLALNLAVRELRLLVLSAAVQILPDYEWRSVEALLRAALLDAFSFERRDLGEGVALSEAIAVLQRVAGVAYVDVDVFDTVGEADAVAALDGIMPKLTLRHRIGARPDRLDPGAGGVARLRPAQIIYLSPHVADTLILQERRP